MNRSFSCWGRRSTALALLLLGVAALPAHAQEFPSKPIRILVHVVGGVPDTVSRVLAASMSTTLGRPVVVENRTGGGGLVAVQELLRSPSDGHSIMCMDSGHWAIFPALQPGHYDPVKDFAAVGTVVSTILIISASDKVPGKSIEDLIALAKAKPGALSYGSSGNGSIHHLTMEAFKAHHGIDLLHVPYTGATAALQGLLSGSIQVLVSSNTVLGAYAKTGQIRRLAAAAQRRSPFAPDVPSFADLKMQDDFAVDIGYLARAGTPKAAIDRLSGALARAVQSPEFAAKVEPLAMEPMYRTAEQLGETVRADVSRYARAVKLTGIKVD